MNGQDSAHVLYVDHQGHPAPLSMSYHATASRRLASATERHPPSTVTEVDSAYCPQCLTFHDATTAATLGYCPKASCRLCPLCRSIASVAVDRDSSDCVYKCGLCDWTSRQCSLNTPITVDNNGNTSKEEIEKASEDLEGLWTERTLQRNQSPEEHYKTMQQTLEDMAKEQVKGQRSTHSWLPTANVRRKDGPEGWSVGSLEESLENRKKLASASIGETVGGKEVQSISLMVDQGLEEGLEGKPVECLLMQGGGVQATTLDALLPLPVPLRPRKSRRCRAELAEGRPGILVKPKLNPLEGDSSLRTGHGQWWKKDSSAIQVLPRVRVSIHASDEMKHAFLLKVSNPTLGIIRMRLAASEYTGEPVWDDASSTTPLLQKILVDPFIDQHVDAHMMPSLVQNLEQTDVCELEPAEDSFLELGKSSNDVPNEVSKWDAGDALLDSKVSKDGPVSSLKLIANKNSTAWFELVVLEEPVQKGLDSAIPLAMEIEVGNGSWESSLVLPEIKEDSGDTKDMVTFDLVIVWENFD